MGFTGSSLCSGPALAHGSSRRHVLEQSLLHRCGSGLHPAFLSFALLNSRTLHSSEELVSELEKQLQVCQRSADGHPITKPCLLDIQKLVATNLALHCLPLPSSPPANLGRLELLLICWSIFSVLLACLLLLSNFCDPMFPPVGFRCLFLCSFLVAISVNI